MVTLELVLIRVGAVEAGGLLRALRRRLFAATEMMGLLLEVYTSFVRRRYHEIEDVRYMTGRAVRPDMYECMFIRVTDRSAHRWLAWLSTRLKL
jgi:hypothetical protein